MGLFRRKKKAMETETGILGDVETERIKSVLGAMGLSPDVCVNCGAQLSEGDLALRAVMCDRCRQLAEPPGGRAE